MRLFFDAMRPKPDNTWVVAKTVEDAKLVLSIQTVEVASLGHDIGYRMLCDQCIQEIGEDTQAMLDNRRMVTSGKSLEDRLKEGCLHCCDGTDLAKWMVDKGAFPKRVLLHDSNPYGVKRMYDLLSPHTRCTAVPYTNISGIIEKTCEGSLAKQ